MARARQSSAPRARRSSAPPERLGTARPGGLLTAAAVVPLGAGLVLAAGLLPGGARVTLGIALLVAGVAVRGLVGTGTGARIGDAVMRATGLALVAGGALVAAGGLALVVGGGLPETAVDVAEYEQTDDPSSRYAGVAAFRTVDAVPAAVLGLLALATAVLLARGRTPARRSRPAVPGAPVASPGDRSTVAVLAGLGGAVVAVAVVGDGALGLGTGARGSVLLAVAAIAAIAGVAGLVERPPGAGGAARAAGIGAGLLLAIVLGEATDLVPVLDGGALVPAGDPPDAPAVLGAQLAVGTATAGALLAAAVLLRDLVLGALPAAVLLRAHPVESAPEAVVGALLVPVLATVLLALAAADRGPLAARVTPAVARAALGAAVVVLLVAVASATGAGGAVLRGFGDAAGDQLARTIVTAVALAAGAVLVVRAEPSAAREAAAVAVVLGIWALHPLWSVAGAGPEAWYAQVAAQVAELVVELALVGVVVAVVRGPWSRAAGALVLADVAGHLGGLVGGDAFSADQVDVVLGVVRETGPSAVLVLFAGIVAVAGPSRLVADAQRAGAVFGLVAAVTVIGAGSTIVALGARFLSTDPTTAPVDDGPLLALTAVLLVLLLGASLLAASTARRPSSAAAAAVALAAVAGGLFAAAVGASRSVRPGDPGPSSGVTLIDALLGFRATGSPLQDAGAGWPVLLGVLGAALLAAGWWLESRRPAPPGAPVG